MNTLPSGWEINYGSYGDMTMDFDEEKIYFSVNECFDQERERINTTETTYNLSLEIIDDSDSEE